ncbi:hypothetical protein [Roseateles amylovorans]|uniref:Pentatricopeptide repeat domain-containing protein n=1 Tax=Roseateles amylovorans TaxID=2978473 RepID=A0ABY6B601_9BURK|nr:hypothetical protein [Roseateles amylovorans]UXH80186.1 hypothetical protein N4261_10025 [Roseateles amylovorans]
MNNAQAFAGSSSVSELMSSLSMKDEPPSLLSSSPSSSLSSSQRGAPAERTRSPASTLALLREWSQQLSEPGAWSADAWRAVGLAILAMPDWAGPSLEVDVQGHGHVYIGAQASPQRIRLVQGQDPRRWKVHHDGAASPTLERCGGDAFFEALAQGLGEQWRAPAKFSDAHGLRRQVSDTLCEGVGGKDGDRYPADWLNELLEQLPEPIHRERGHEHSVRVVRHAMLMASPEAAPEAQGTLPSRVAPRLMSAPELSSSIQTEGAHHTNSFSYLFEPEVRGMVNRAQRALHAKDFDEACRLVERIEPRFKTPFSIVSKICGIAVREGHIQRAVQMIERLAKGSKAMFRPNIGFDAAINTLDLHLAALFTPETVPKQYYPADLRSPQSDTDTQALLDALHKSGAACTGMATVLFSLHVDRGNLKEGTHVIVGMHGTGRLRQAIERCAKDYRWECEPTKRFGTSFDHPGALVILPTNRNLARFHRYERTPDDQLMRFIDGLVADCARGGELRDDRSRQTRQRAVHMGMGINGLLSLLDSQGKAPINFYEDVFRDAIVAGRPDDYEPALDALLDRFKPLPPQTWLRLLSLAARENVNTWDCCGLVLSRMQREGVAMTDEAACLMVTAARSNQDFYAAEKLVAVANRAVCPINERLLQAFMRSSAFLGWPQKWDHFKRQLSGKGRQAFEAIRSYETILLSRRKKYGQAMELYAQLRRAGTPFDRLVIRRLLNDLWNAGMWRQAVDVLQGCVNSSDGIYLPPLGLSRVESITTLKLPRYALLQSGSDPECPSLSLPEAMSILGLHVVKGRLPAGSHILLGAKDAAINETQARPGLSAMGLVLRPLSATGARDAVAWVLCETSTSEVDGSSTPTPGVGRSTHRR